jgi:hypothetical protein
MIAAGVWLCLGFNYASLEDFQTSDFLFEDFSQPSASLERKLSAALHDMHGRVLPFAQLVDSITQLYNCYYWAHTVALAFVLMRVFQYLMFQRHLSMVTDTFQGIMDDLLHIGLVLIIVCYVFGVINSMTVGDNDEAFQTIFGSFFTMAEVTFGLYKPASDTSFVQSLFKYSPHVLPSEMGINWVPFAILVAFKVLVTMLLFKLLMGVVMESYKKNKPRAHVPSLRDDLHLFSTIAYAEVRWMILYSLSKMFGQWISIESVGFVPITHVALAISHYEKVLQRGQTKVTFKPDVDSHGKFEELGLDVDESGTVMGVGQGSQGSRNCIKQGWTIFKVNDKDFSKAVLEACKTGKAHYEISFITHLITGIKYRATQDITYDGAECMVEGSIGEVVAIDVDGADIRFHEGGEPRIRRRDFSKLCVDEWQRVYIGLDHFDTVLKVLNGIFDQNFLRVAAQGVISTNNFKTVRRLDAMYCLSQYGTNRKMARVRYAKMSCKEADKAKAKEDNGDPSQLLHEEMHAKIKELRRHWKGEDDSVAFLTAPAKKRFISKARLTFDTFDFSCIGIVDARYVSLMLDHIGFEIGPKKLQSIVKRHDEDYDGCFSFEEFMSLMNDEDLIGHYLHDNDKQGVKFEEFHTTATKTAVVRKFREVKVPLLRLPA